MQGLVRTPLEPGCGKPESKIRAARGTKQGLGFSRDISAGVLERKDTSLVTESWSKNTWKGAQDQPP